MSLELKIEALTAAVIALTTKLESHAAPAPTPAPVAAPVPVVAAPVVVAVPVAAPAPVAPTLTVVPVAAAPFSNHSEMVAFLMGRYKELGPRGSEMQECIKKLGCNNVNEIKPEQYGQVHALVAAL